ncbi:hypothetical protein [Runella aurantiaca]|nr:hypothetical protein [Runella aurantiaca]
MAFATVRKSPLGDTALTTLPTIPEDRRPKPVHPVGVVVKPCGAFGTLAYFNRQPRGLPPLAVIGGSMMRAMALRFGGENVGIRTTNGVTELPVLTQTVADCNSVDADILPGSPIFAAGFDYNDTALPDRKEVTWPTVARYITIPCPSGFDGVIKREQKCQLQYDPLSEEHEEGEILIGGDKTPNKKARINKTWDCDTAADGPATADEITAFCRDPTDVLAKPADSPLAMQAKNMRVLLEDNNPNGFYDFKCRGSGGDCTAAPVTNPEVPKGTYYRCEQSSAQTPYYVVNPQRPLQLDGAGNVVGGGASQDCGRNWTGDLTARYQVRRCNLYRNNGSGEELVRQSQTLYHIAYAGAKCSTTVNTTVACPVGNAAGRLPVVRRMTMVKPAALDWRPAIPGTADWSTSTISTNDSRQEIKDMADEKGFIVPDTTRAELDAADTNTEWALKLAAAMERRDPSSMDNKVVACDNTGEPCKVESSSEIRIVVDQTSSRPLASLLGGTFTLRNLQCVAGTGTCHPLLGDDQPKTCSGRCLVDASKGPTDITISGGNYELLLESYLAAVTKNLPPDVTITVDRVSNGNSLALFTDTGSICDLAAAKTPRLMVFGYALTNGNNNYTSTISCPALSGQAYNRPYDLLSDAISSFVGKGGQLRVYSSGEFASLWATAGIAGTTGNELVEAGSASRALADWIKNPIGGTPVSIGNPCDLVR